LQKSGFPIFVASFVEGFVEKSPNSIKVATKAAKKSLSRAHFANAFS